MVIENSRNLKNDIIIKNLDIGLFYIYLAYIHISVSALQ